MASQLLNVLKNCDTITYNEPGTGDAYALLHFLDRYHRFQLTFDLLAHHGLMPLRQGNIDVLDIGTGPGPSMFAISDFYCDRFGYAELIAHASRASTLGSIMWSRVSSSGIGYITSPNTPISMLQQEGDVPSTMGPLVILAINSMKRGTPGIRTMTATTDLSYIRRHRFDLVIFSNFLTTRRQVLHFQRELRDCARFLRKNGILLVVGATATSAEVPNISTTPSRGSSLGKGKSRKFIACAMS